VAPLSAAVPVYEPLLKPKVEAGSNAWHIQTVCFFDCGAIGIALQLKSIKDLAILIDEMNSIARHYQYHCYLSPSFRNVRGVLFFLLDV
jgi:hypothetical protein